MRQTESTSRRSGQSPSRRAARLRARPTLRARKARVSVLVPVKNEAENLRRCLPALAWADEVFVVDSQSSDDTAAVAAEHGARVVQFHFNGVYPKKKNWALENLPFRNEWVLIVDADEVVVPELAEEIARRTAADECDGYLLNMKYFFLGRRIRHCGYAEAWNLRLFKHRLGRYEKMPVAPGTQTGDNEAHEHVELRGKVARLDHELDHHAYPDHRGLGREAQPLRDLGGRDVRALPERARPGLARRGQAAQAPAQEGLSPPAVAAR